jgi:hypothetical protein
MGNSPFVNRNLASSARKRFSRSEVVGIAAEPGPNSPFSFFAFFASTPATLREGGAIFRTLS